MADFVKPFMVRGLAGRGTAICGPGTRSKEAGKDLHGLPYFSPARHDTNVVSSYSQVTGLALLKTSREAKEKLRNHTHTASYPVDTSVALRVNHIA